MVYVWSCSGLGRGRTAARITCRVDEAIPERYPRMTGAHGRPVDSPSPHAGNTLQEAVGAFAALMGHLKATNPRHTVIMVQVENEPGTWGSVRDHSPAAQKLFESPVPAALPGSTAQRGYRPPRRKLAGGFRLRVGG